MGQYTLRADGDDIVVTQVVRLSRDTAARRLTRVHGYRPKDKPRINLTGIDSTITKWIVAEDLTQPSPDWNLSYTADELVAAHAILDRLCPRPDGGEQ